MHICAIIRFICIVHIMHSMIMHRIPVLGCIGSGSRWWVLWSSCSGWSSRARTPPTPPVMYEFHAFLYEFHTFRFVSLNLLPLPADRTTLMFMEHLMTSRYNTCNNWACSVVVIALYLYTQGPGFEPGLFHKACYMPLWLLNEEWSYGFFPVTCHSLGRVQRLLQ